MSYDLFLKTSINSYSYCDNLYFIASYLSFILR